MKKRTKEPWMDAADFGRSIPDGLGVNLLVRDIAASVAFQREVLGAGIVYEDEDFAVLRGYGAIWLLHADHAYLENPLTGIVGGTETRGAGVELRLYGCDPDAAEARAEARGDIVLAGSLDKPHGLRECILIDPDGYTWLPTVPSLDKDS